MINQNIIKEKVTLQNHQLEDNLFNQEMLLSFFLENIEEEELLS